MLFLDRVLAGTSPRRWPFSFLCFQETLLVSHASFPLLLWSSAPHSLWGRSLCPTAAGSLREPSVPPGAQGGYMIRLWASAEGAEAGHGAWGGAVAVRCP